MPNQHVDRWLLPEDGIVDDIAVDIAARGERPVRLTPTERRLAAKRILAGGGNVVTVAIRLRIQPQAAVALATEIRNRRAEAGRDAA
jgi:hypothetical protein